MPHLNIKIFGAVQGVFFRAAAQDAAQKLNITGYATNGNNNTVFIEAEGRDEALQKFVDWCHRGPPLAKVSKVETEEGQLKNFTDFKTD